MKRALIVDDEQNGREALKSILEKFTKDITIIGEAENVRDGINKIEDLEPEVVFLDVEMPDGTGFDLLEKVQKRNFEVVFITAFDNYAIKAFQFSAIDYLLKPIDPLLLKSTIEKLNQNTEINDISKKLDVLFGNKSKPEKITLPTTEGIHIIKIKNIVRCSADDCYTNFIMNDGNKIIVSKTLKEYSELLEDLNFFRVHQSHLVNLDYIERFVNTDGAYLIMSNGDQVDVSRRRKKSLLDTLSLIN
jgi:two-component system LytT family response regulator